MTTPIVLFATRYGPPIYEIVEKACPPELMVRFLDSGDEQALLEHLREAHFVIGGKLTRAVRQLPARHAQRGAPQPGGVRWRSKDGALAR